MAGVRQPRSRSSPAAPSLPGSPVSNGPSACPGSVGGAVRMNAGGHGSRHGRLVARGPRGRSRGPAKMSRCRRRSVRSDTGGRRSARHQVVVAARAATSGRGRRRRRRAGARPRSSAGAASTSRAGQNAGSVFTNPPGDSAGRLIDVAGCKGLRHRHGRGVDEARQLHPGRRRRLGRRRRRPDGRACGDRVRGVLRRGPPRRDAARRVRSRARGRGGSPVVTDALDPDRTQELTIIQPDPPPVVLDQPAVLDRAPCPRRAARRSVAGRRRRALRGTPRRGPDPDEVRPSPSPTPRPGVDRRHPRDGPRRRRRRVLAGARRRPHRHHRHQAAHPCRSRRRTGLRIGSPTALVDPGEVEARLRKDPRFLRVSVVDGSSRRRSRSASPTVGPLPVWPARPSA